jgi:hypothetical protein
MRTGICFDVTADDRARLEAMSNEHFNTHPDEINWADVGNVSRIERRLKELLDMLKMEGEYSK